jgi:hypothetical protein
MEARALAKFTPPNGKLQNLGRDFNVKVPELLHYDENAHVLILEDLGEVMSLASWIASFDSLLPSNHSSSETSLVNLADDLGRRIGVFFGRLHSPSTLRDAAFKGDDNWNVEDSLANNFGFEVVLDCAINPIKSKLAKYVPQVSKARKVSKTADELWSIVLDNFTRSVSSEEQSFVLGDFYPGSVLLPQNVQVGSQIGVIDWEFSGLGRGLHGDLAQCLAHLSLALFRCESTTSARYTAVKALIHGILSAYVNESRKDGGLLCTRTKSNQELMKTFRSAVITYAGEMLNMEYPSKEDNDEKTDSTIRAQDLQIADNAIWCLERVNAITGNTAENPNLESILEELRQSPELRHLWTCIAWPLQTVAIDI